jgi:hypothetical protein
MARHHHVRWDYEQRMRAPVAIDVVLLDRNASEPTRNEPATFVPEAHRQEC